MRISRKKFRTFFAIFVSRPTEYLIPAFNGAYTRSNLFRKLVDITLPSKIFINMST